MNLKNNTIKTEVEFWSNQNTTYKYIIEYFAPLFLMVDNLSEIKSISKLELKKFVFGILMSPLYFKNVDKSDDYDEKRKEIDDLISLVTNKLIEYLKSNEYRSYIIEQQITGTKTIEIDGIKDIVSTKAILNHINRTGKFPLTPKDVEDIEQDYSNYYRKLNKTKIVNAIDDLETKYSRVLENFKFWNGIDDKVHGRKNIFKGVSEEDFIMMIKTANFKSINKSGRSQRVKFNIYVLSKELDENWGEKAANSLNTTLKECAKRTTFYEYDSLKSMYLQ